MDSMLRISDGASLGLHTMGLLARHPERRFLNSEIAGFFGASEHSLSKVLQQLVKAGLLQSVRGPAGGFKLRRPAAEINVLSIYEAVDGPIGTPTCLLGSNSCQGERCLLGGVVEKVHALIIECFREGTLADLAGSMRLEDERFGIPLEIELPAPGPDTQDPAPCADCSPNTDCPRTACPRGDEAETVPEPVASE